MTFVLANYKKEQQVDPCYFLIQYYLFFIVAQKLKSLFNVSKARYKVI